MYNARLIVFYFQHFGISGFFVFLFFSDEEFVVILVVHMLNSTTEMALDRTVSLIHLTGRSFLAIHPAHNFRR